MRHIRNFCTRILFAVMAAAGWIGLIVALGRSAEASIADDPRYFLPISEIQCNPPSDQDRADFLEQVHYYGKLPERLHLVDPDLPAQLIEAFSKHPDVEEVASITMNSKQLKVLLRYRK